jgi:2-methylaconitate cis-trans-isomerase PrpF
MHWIPACIIRGGTSKGLFFNGSKLPLQGQHLDSFFLKAMGSPDPYGEQLDGLGGGTSSTSKIVVVTKSKNPNFDVDYLFGQVDIKNRSVDYSGSCGNMAAGVGLFALS